MNKEVLSIIEEMRRIKTLSSEINSKLNKLYGNRYSEALKTVAEGGVIRVRFIPSLRILWVVKGTRRNYLVIPLIYCSCEDFYLNVVLRRTIDLCHHILAQMIADALGRFKSIEIPDDLLFKFLHEWLVV
ncbi:MAG: hypothetical protein DRZ82_08530 [Thermoprotei archaeon]|nr:MAG: hypothetical protein DRZ82_08530 [Thermoprotei archaeon]